MDSFKRSGRKSKKAIKKMATDRLDEVLTGGGGKKRKTKRIHHHHHRQKKHKTWLDM